MSNLAYYDEICRMSLFTRTHNLILNKVSIINQIFLCRHDFDPSNPCVFRPGLAHDYHVAICGRVVCSWHVWDLAGAGYAFALLETVANVLWAVRSSGWLALPLSPRTSADCVRSV